jgi:hypothetical protein
MIDYVLQILTVIAVGFGLACYGTWRGRKERTTEKTDPRQMPLLPKHSNHPRELVTR